MPDYEHITCEIERGRARITLNRPQKRNALSFALLTELADALWNADDDKRVHSVILRGAGKSFCAGYDITPGVNAPGTANSTTFLPLKISSVEISFGPSAVGVISFIDGMLSPTLMVTSWPFLN